MGLQSMEFPGHGTKIFIFCSLGDHFFPLMKSNPTHELSQDASLLA